MKVPRVLIIAGSDSGGGAGIQADIKTVTMLGGHAMTAVTAITAQNTLGVTGVWPLPAEAVIAQIDAVVSDLGVDAVKIGMIGSAEIALAVADRLALDDLRDVPMVFDPVMIATSGSMLADEATVATFRSLVERATVSTPNVEELAVLAKRSIGSQDDVQFAAGKLIRNGGAILATGYRPRDEEAPIEEQEREEALGGRASGKDHLYDLLFSRPAGGYWECAFRGTRIDTIHDHGTGCTLASGIATGLGAGLSLPDAIGRAREYVRAALSTAPGYGAGHGPMGHALGGVPFNVVQLD